MRKIRKIFYSIIALFLVVLSFVTYKVLWDSENTKQVFYPMSKQERGLLHSGDIILRRGYGMFSDGIVKVQQSKYPVSHCAMILADSGKIKVAHSLSSSVAEIDGAQTQSLQRFLNESVPNTVMVVRFKSSRDTIQQLLNRMKYYTNKHVPFDHEFDKSDTTRFYCTELFHHCFNQVLGRDIFNTLENGNFTGVIDLSTFQDTSYFEPIINHNLRDN